MQQHHPPNIDNDPIRNKQIESSELLPRKNLFTMMKSKTPTNTFNNSNSKLPDMYHGNIYNENYSRNDSLNEEMLEKDKRIQELEFKIQQIEFEKDSFKNKLGIIKKYEEDNKKLTLKLKEEYEKNKEIIIIRNKLSLFEKSKKEDDRMISELKKKLNEMDENEEGITINVMDSVEDEDEEIKEIDYDEIYKKTLEAENNRNLNLEKYKNDKLKNMISKHLVNVSNETIDDIFIKMEIDDKTTITKNLISLIIYEIKQ